MIEGRKEPTSLGAEALPAGFGEISDILRRHSSPGVRVPPEQPKAPLVGLIALASHWLKKRGERD